MLAGRDLVATGTGAGTTTGAQALAGRDLTLGNGANFDFAATGLQYQFGRDLTVRAQGISTAGRQVPPQLTLAAGQLNNQGGPASHRQRQRQRHRLEQPGSDRGQRPGHAGSGTLTNTGGLVTGQNVTIGGAVNNSAGVISGSNSVAMTTLALNNDAGVIESGTGGISIDTQGNTLTNTNSGAARGIVSQGAITIAAGDINNQAGYIGANGALFITQSSNIDNQGGTLLGLGNSSVTTSGTLNNQGGSILSGADLAASAATLNNSNSGTLYAGRDLSVTASAIDNSNTKNGSYTTGLLAGRNATITAGTINNTNGAIVSPGDTAIRATTQPEQHAGPDRRQHGHHRHAGADQHGRPRRRAAAHDPAGTPIQRRRRAGQQWRPGPAGWQGNHTNSGTVSANGDLSISTTGSYTNQGRLSAQNNLSLVASDIDNQVGAIIDSQVTTLTASGAVNNAGLINSTAGETTITADSVNNTGRIYGDSIAITATTHNAGAAAVIASRGGDVTINGQLNNTDGAQVFSLGSIQINGSARNDGSTINAMRNVGITGALTNTNAGFTTGNANAHRAGRRPVHHPQ